MSVSESKLTKTEFCGSLEWRIDIHWSGLVGMHRLDDKRVAKIELATRGVSQHYPGFRVTVLNKNEGSVDVTYFKFDDHLDGSLEGRTDSHEGFTMSNLNYEVISYCGWKWHIAIPKNTRPFCEAIEVHLNFFL